MRRVLGRNLHLHLMSNKRRVYTHLSGLFPQPSLFYLISYLLVPALAAGVTHVPQYRVRLYHDEAKVAGQLSFIPLSSASRCCGPHALLASHNEKSVYVATCRNVSLIARVFFPITAGIARCTLLEVYFHAA